MSSADARRAGVTLVELLVGLVLAGLLAGILFQAIQGQSRFVALQSAREEAQRNVRSSLDLIAGELRAAPPEGLIVAGPHEVTFQLPRAWGVVCNRNGATSMDVLFPATVTADMLAASSASGLAADAGTDTARDWRPVATMGTARAAVTAVAPVSAESRPCFDLRGAPGDSRDVIARRITGTNFPAVEPGALVYLYHVVRYAVARDAGEWWIYRSNGLTGSTPTMQPMAGPLQGAEALRFRYLDRSGAVVPAPEKDATARARVARIQVRVGAQGRTGLGVGLVTRTDSTTVYLRNR